MTNSIFTVIGVFIALSLWPSFSFEQSVDFEELGSIGLVDISKAFVSPENRDLYVSSIESVLFKSSDNGQSWKRQYWPTDEHIFKDVKFLENDIPLVSVGRWRFPFYNRLAILEDEQYRFILPPELDTLNEIIHTVYENDIFIYHDRKFYISKDLGHTFTEHLDREVSRGEVRELFVTQENIIVYEVEQFEDSVFRYERGHLKIYDRNFDIIKENTFEFTWRFSNSSFGKLEIVDDKVVVIDSYNNFIYYSTNLGDTFTKKAQEDPIGSVDFHITNENLYFVLDNTLDKSYVVFTIRLDSNFISNPTDILYSGTTCESARFFNNNLMRVDRCTEQFNIVNLTDGVQENYSSISLPSTRIDIIHSAEDGTLQADMNNYVFQYDSNNNEWNRSYKLASLSSFLDNGEYLFSNPNNYFTSDSIDGIGKISLDGEIDYWDIGFDTLTEFLPGRMVSFNDDNLRIVFDFYQHSTGRLFISENKEPFVERSLNSYWLYSSNIKSRYIDNKVLMVARFSNFRSGIWVYDVIENALSEYEDPILSVLDESFSFEVNKKGMIYANFDNTFLPDDNDYFVTYYKTDLESTFQPGGRGPNGAIYHCEAFDYNIIITRNDNIFIQPDVLSNYSKVEINNRNFVDIQAACFDKDGVLYLAVDYGRIVKISNLSTMTSVSPSNTVIHDFQCYPNPTSDVLNLNSSSMLHNVGLYDIHGRQIKTLSQISGITQFDISDLNSGIYLLKAEALEGQTYSQKIIKH